jgi:hypothetical protein
MASARSSLLTAVATGSTKLQCFFRTETWKACVVTAHVLLDPKIHRDTVGPEKKHKCPWSARKCKNEGLSKLPKCKHQSPSSSIRHQQSTKQRIGVISRVQKG